MKKYFPVYVRAPLIFAIIFAALEFFIDSGDRPAFIKYPEVSLFLFIVVFILIAIEIMVAAVDKVTNALMTEEQKARLAAADETDFTQSEWFIKLKGFFIKGKSIEEEGTVLMNHDYDGIHELDNVLPPWWVKLFYVTILFAAVYLVRFHIMDGDDQKAEFDTEMNEARIAVEEYRKTAKDLIDANTVTLLTDAGELAEGKKIFETNCAACHRGDAGGAIGPNLTDEHWILGGGIKNVFHTITEGGRDGKGMVPWKGTLKPSEIQKVASYVISLQGSNPKDPKAPDGEVWKDETTKAPEVAANSK